MPDWEEWSPPATPHVRGRYERFGPGARHVRLVEATCCCCGATLRHACTTHQVRQHIARFAAQHLRCGAPRGPQ